MPLTRSFKETVKARIQNDPSYGHELFAEAIECMIGGDIETGKGVMRDFINSTLGFNGLSELTGIPEKSLMRMFSRGGNPQARKLFEITKRIQENMGFQVGVEVQVPPESHHPEAVTYIVLIDESELTMALPVSSPDNPWSDFEMGQVNLASDKPWVQAQKIRLPSGQIADITDFVMGGLHWVESRENSVEIRWDRRHAYDNQTKEPTKQIFMTGGEGPFPPGESRP